MTQTLIRGLFANFPLWMLLLGLIFGIAHARRVRPSEAPGALAREMIFWSIGMSGLWGFVFHVFFPSLASGRIGWQSNGFETEVGLANLAIGVLGIAALFRSIEFSWAATVAAAIFLLGAAANHIVGIVAAKNFAPGNAGTILWTDILIPVVTLALTARASLARHRD
jgi:hypothetical protein